MLCVCPKLDGPVTLKPRDDAVTLLVVSSLPLLTLPPPPVADGLHGGGAVVCPAALALCELPRVVAWRTGWAPPRLCIDSADVELNDTDGLAVGDVVFDGDVVTAHAR